MLKLHDILRESNKTCKKYGIFGIYGVVRLRKVLNLRYVDKHVLF